jgi:4-amino-4-deoxy-L-arabinose transferase-like glycosyltransferase
MSLFRVGLPSGPPSEMAIGHGAEWAMRLPFCLMSLLALYGVYLVAARFVSRRAAVIAVVALGTFPMFSLVARQAMTDMPFVGPMTLALALGTLALFEDDDRRAMIVRCRTTGACSASRSWARSCSGRPSCRSWRRGTRAA